MTTTESKYLVQGMHLKDSKGAIWDVGNISSSGVVIELNGGGRRYDTEVIPKYFDFNTHEYWEGHEKVREYDNNGRWRLIEIIGEQYGDTEYWKDTPFRIRMNKGGENWNEYKTLADALKDWARIDELYAR